MISMINNSTNPCFGSSYQNLQKLNSEIKKLGKNPTIDDYRKIKNMASELKSLAENEIEYNIKNNKTKEKIDKCVQKIFEKFAKLFSNTKPHGDNDLSKTIIKAVLTGNILKDLATGVVSTAQSFTNPDLPKDKRLFMGSYDIAACLTTISLSFLLGNALVGKIINSYEKALKPLNSLPKQKMVIAGLTAFTTIILQSIVAKRMLAPAISTPMASILKSRLENKEKNS